MRTAIRHALLGLALLAATPSVRAEITWGGNLGVSLTQNNSWTGTASSSDTIGWFAGSLHLDASFFAPGALSLGAWADYRGYRASGGAASDGFNYGARLSALAQTPVRLDASVMRSTVDFTSDSSKVRTGTTRVDAASASVSLVDPDYPYLSAAVRSSNLSNRVAGAAAVQSDSTALNMEVGQGVDSANYRLSYESSWANGDYAESNYGSHLVNFRTAATLAANFLARVDATYYLRLPTLVSTFNPRIDTQSVSSWLQWGGTAEASGGGGYNYSSSLFDVPGEPVRESIAHTLSAYGSRQLTPEVAVDLNAGASATQTRANALEQSATGEQLSATVRWARPEQGYRANSYLSGGVGALQPAGGPDSVAWSIGTGAGIAFPVSTWWVNTGLNLSYDANTNASAGHRARVMGTATAAGMPLGWDFNSQLNLGYVTSDSPAFGARRSLDASLLAIARRAGFTYQLNGGVTDSLAEVLVPGSAPAVTLAPADYNTQSRYAILSATIPTIRNLSLSVIGRYLSFTSPGRGTQWETGATLSVAYAIGAFQLTLYDTITTGGSQSTSTGTQNLLFLSLSRSFGR
jgi:hypothetical protein